MRFCGREITFGTPSTDHTGDLIDKLTARELPSAAAGQRSLEKARKEQAKREQAEARAIAAIFQEE